MTEHVALEKRIATLEESVDGLHKDSIRTQGAIASIATHIDSIVETMHVIDQKLDEQRTRRPELAGLAAVAAVILSIGAYSGSIINDKLEDTKTVLTTDVAKLEAEVDARGPLIGKYETLVDIQARQIERLQDRVDHLHDGE
jgi:chromosome segregation ATPase